MKKYILLFLTLFSVLCLQAQTEELKVATYNIRFKNNYDDSNGNGWVERHPSVVDFIQNWDIIGTQEGVHKQITDLEASLPGYGYIGMPRDGWQSGEYCAIFYNKEKFDVLDTHTFWFSATPEVPSYAKKAKRRRICTWGKFREKETALHFYVFNLHMEHKVKKARKEAVKLLIKKVESIAGEYPFVITGDFNFSQYAEEYKLLSSHFSDSYGLTSDKENGDKGTNRGFYPGTTEDSGKRIDHIFISPNFFRVNKYVIATTTYENSKGRERYPSDHFPVAVNLGYDYYLAD